MHLLIKIYRHGRNFLLGGINTQLYCLLAIQDTMNRHTADAHLLRNLVGTQPLLT